MKPNRPCINKAWRLTAKLVPCRPDQVQQFILAHYLHKSPAVVTLCLRIQVSEDPVGAIIFALPPKQTRVRYGGTTWELARLYLADSVPANAETWAIGQALKHIKANHKEVRFVVSYADPSVGHEGVIYKASNFTYDGMTDDERVTARFDMVSADVQADLLGAVPQKKYSRAGHVPFGAHVERLSRISKHRFVMEIR